MQTYYLVRYTQGNKLKPVCTGRNTGLGAGLTKIIKH